MKFRTTTMLAIAVLALAGCHRDVPALPAAAAATQAATEPAGTNAQRIVFLGDSLTAGYGVEPGEAFPSLIAAQLKADGVAARVVNAGVSGDTTAGGLRRLDWVLRQRPDVLVVCLGGNDGLRSLDVAATMNNLRQIIVKAKASGADVMLLGMLLPTNYGPEYRAQFAAMYPALAKELDVPLVPFVLAGVGGVTEMNQADGIHPTAAGHKVVAENVIGPLLKVLRTRPSRDAR